MEVLESIMKRQSVRMYEKKDVPNELIGQMLIAAVKAPSAGNVQPWEFIVVKDNKIKKELSLASLKQKHIEDASTVIVVCANLEKSADKYGDRGKTLYCIQDTAAAIENMLLVATSLELGTCWVGAFEEGKVKSILNIPERLRPMALITVGFPVSYVKNNKTLRRQFENVTYSEKYGEGLKWIDKDTKEWRFKITPLGDQIKKVKERITEKK